MVRTALLALATSCPTLLAGVAYADPAAPAADADAAPAPNQPTDAKPDKFWAIHAQATDVLQYHPSFRSPFEGRNSLPGEAELANTLNAAVLVGLRPWKGGQAWFDGEVNQGFAPGNTEGVAGYVNGEGAKVGHHSPYFRPQRWFFRQTFELGGGKDEVDPGPSEFGGETTRNRLVITFGKFSLTDVMDDNQYAHDPQNDFLNWAIIDNGSWDYAADAWGFSRGVTAELYWQDWTARGALMELSNIPNNANLTPAFHQFQLDGELEYQQKWLGREGKIKLLGFASRGQMGRFDDALALAALTHSTPDTALVRHYRTRYGLSLNVEQPVSDNGGLFLRAGWADGRYETYEYADIDATVAGGGSVSGARWGRKDDTAALALVVNSISNAHQQFLAAGGLGILVGDGRLPHPGAEAIVETYYSLAVLKWARLTFDYQLIANPAYNRDRGPVSVLGLRLHVQE